mgnify:CR=1 FL=1|jgi:hypothetical protein
MEKNISKATAIKTLGIIEQYANEYPAYLSEKTDYARGYKEGVLIVKQILKDILEENLLEEA